VHELSIVESVIEAVTEAAEKAGARKVTVVTLRVGALAGVVEDALRFSYDIATEDTMLAGSQFVVHALPAVIHCDACNADRELSATLNFSCPICETLSLQLLQGRELEIESFEIEVDGDDSNS
jgi:hydrogenase nickel incorporation protein HypA/HybF